MALGLSSEILCKRRRGTREISPSSDGYSILNYGETGWAKTGRTPSGCGLWLVLPLFFFFILPYSLYYHFTQVKCCLIRLILNAVSFLKNVDLISKECSTGYSCFMIFRSDRKSLPILEFQGRHGTQGAWNRANFRQLWASQSSFWITEAQIPTFHVYPMKSGTELRSR